MARDSLSPGIMGLSISYALQVSLTLKWWDAEQMYTQVLTSSIFLTGHNIFELAGTDVLWARD